MEKFFWEDFFSELLADLLLGQDVEELAKMLGKASNTVLCFTYKSKPMNLPNVKQLGEILEYVNRTRPQAVSSALKKFCARFGVVAGSRGEVLRQIAGECEAVKSEARTQAPSGGQVKFP